MRPSSDDDRWAPRRANPWLTSTLVVAALCAACVGNIGDRPDGIDGAGGPTTVPPEAAMHRLTRSQYENTLLDLFGPIELPPDLETDALLHGFSNVAAASATISPLAAEQFEAAAYHVIAQVFGDVVRRQQLVGCTPTTGDDACTRGFLEDFGLRAWRRPLAADEIDEITTLTATLGDKLDDPWKGLEFGVAALLQSPHFLFRVEQGSPHPERPEQLVLTGWEVATRLSYLVWNSTPDDELLAAAERGDLASAEGIAAEAERLLEAPRARRALLHFYGEFLNLQRLADLTKNVEVYPQMSTTLGHSMRREIEKTFEHLVFEEDGDVRQLLDSKVTFVNAELAELYGLPTKERAAWWQVVWDEDSPRAGLLGTAGILALYAHNTATSPTLRGKFIRMNVLCQDIPAPPPGVVTSLDGAGDAKTMRDKLAAHREDPTCAACHDKMDPLGLGLENFDAIGAYRTTENGYPIDATGDLDGQPFDGARDLAEMLATMPEVGSCVARRFYRHGLGHLEERAEEPAIEALAARFAEGGYRVKDLVAQLVVSDAFRFASAPSAE